MPNKQAGQVKSSLLDIQKSLSDKVTSTDPSIIAEVDVIELRVVVENNCFRKGEIIEKVFFDVSEPNYPRLPPKTDLI